MSRTKRAFINSLTAAIFSILFIASGIILPRLIIGKFGSDINGLTVSIQQFIGYLSYLELGIASTFIFSLYKPLAEQNHEEITGLVLSARKSYNRTSLYFFIGILVVAGLYPFVVNIGGIEIWMVIALVIIIGFAGLMDMYSVAKYRVLLTADQKVHVINIVFSLGIILSFTLSVILIYFGQHIILIKAVPLVTIVFRSLFLRYYVKKKYSYIDFKKRQNQVSSTTKIKRSDAMLMEVSKTVAYSLPVLALSIFSSLQTVSIFSVYYLVFSGLLTIISTLTSGSTATFGELLSKNDGTDTKRIYSTFELVLVNTQTILYTCAIVLIMFFVRLYVAGLPDAGDYINLLFGILFALWAYIDNFRLPAQTIIQAAGKFKEARYANIVYLASELIFLSILTPFFGILGVLIAMTTSSFIKTIWFLVIVKKHIFHDYFYKSLIRFLVGLTIVTSIFFLFNNFIHLPIYSFWHFILWGFIMVGGVAIVTFGINFLMDKNQTKDIFKRFIAIFTRNKNKQGNAETKSS